MRKNIISYLILSLLSIGAVLAKSDKIVNLKSSKTEIKLVSNKQTSLLIENTIAAFMLSEKITKEGQFVSINIPKYTIPTARIGFPELPVLNELIEIPHDAEVIVKVVSFDEEIVDINNHNFNDRIVPVQASLSKSEDAEFAVFQYNKAFYLKNEYD